MRYEAQFFCSRVYLGAKSLSSRACGLDLLLTIYRVALSMIGVIRLNTQSVGVMSTGIKEVGMNETIFISFRQREFSVDGHLDWVIAGVGTCEGCGQKDAPLAVNEMLVEEVRDGDMQVPIDLNAPIVVGLKKELERILKVGKRLCSDCLPKVPKEIPGR